MAVIEAEGLTKHFRAKSGVFGGDRGVVRAVDGISFAIEPGQTLGVVGESGCGKTTTAKLVRGISKSSTPEAAVPIGSRFKRSFRTPMRRSIRGCGSARSLPNR
jgi:ABC-type oligopeptide transport system ATPase subunit